MVKLDLISFCSSSIRSAYDPVDKSHSPIRSIDIPGRNQSFLIQILTSVFSNLKIYGFKNLFSKLIFL